MMDFALQKAFVLHYRPYQETSLLLELLTPKNGRLGVVAKNARRAKSSLKGLLQPFTPLEITLQGKGDLLTLQTAEAIAAPIILKGHALLSGFYINELLMYLLHRYDTCENIFSSYEHTLQQLSHQDAEKVLRQFEKNLLFALAK